LATFWNNFQAGKSCRGTWLLRWFIATTAAMQAEQQLERINCSLTPLAIVKLQRANNLKLALEIKMSNSQFYGVDAERVSLNR